MGLEESGIGRGQAHPLAMCLAPNAAREAMVEEEEVGGVGEEEREKETARLPRLEEPKKKVPTTPRQGGKLLLSANPSFSPSRTSQQREKGEVRLLQQIENATPRRETR